jgi:hypothetical protein
MRPRLNDYAAWDLLLIERRRIMLERIIAEFPDVLKTQRTKVDVLRAQLRITP